jgi:hypothetical protein
MNNMLAKKINTNDGVILPYSGEYADIIRTQPEKRDYKYLGSRVEVRSVEQTDGQYVVRVDLLRGRGQTCPHCGHDKINRFGTYLPKLKDLPYESKVGHVFTSELTITVHRYFCPKCQKLINELMPEELSSYAVSTLMTRALSMWLVHATGQGMKQDLALAATGYSKPWLRKWLRELRQYKQDMPAK